MAKLSDAEVSSGLAALPGWSREGDEITKQFELPTFMDAIRFVDRVAEQAEAANHHPDLDIRYRKVRVVLTTHSEGGISDKDLALADEIERAAGG
jgi:4a-hydroxytetrahydrobiopterin dehydratase